MENTEIKSGTKEVKNQIVLKNLTRRQKELLSYAGVISAGIGLGGGLFTLYSMDEPNIIPTMENPEDMESTQGNLGSIVSANVSTPQEEQNESVILLTKNPVHEMNDENMLFSDAFKIARSINGPGGWFIWKDNAYNTYYKEEWQSMPQSEKNEYLASIDVQSTSDTMQPVVTAEIIAEPTEPEQAEIEDMTNAEIITLDDDTDFEQQGVFELSDDIEITVLSDNESIKLDSVIMDSNQITEFPWAETSNEVNDQLTDNQASAIVFDEEMKDESAPVEELSDIEEYPWGEPVEQKEPAFSVSLADETIAAKESINPIAIDPNEITEYPWGEPVEQKEPAVSVSLADTPIAAEETINPTVVDPNEITEYPWGEPVEQKEPAVSVSLADTPIVAEETINPTVVDPNEITEYPWGEPVGKEGLVAEKEETGLIVDPASPIDIQSPAMASFQDIEEFPWGEKNIHYQPVTETVNSEIAGEIIFPENESENIGIIVSDVIEPVFHSQLPPSFNDVTEFPWGESILDSQMGLNEQPDNEDNSL